MELFAKDTKAGRFEVRIEQGLGGSTMAAYLNGERHAQGTPYRLDNKTIARLGGEITHVMGKVGLTTAECEAIQSAFSAAATAARNPLETLRIERRALVCAWQGAMDDQESAQERGHNHDGSAATAAYRSHQAAVDAAAAALRQFDAAHPEIAAEIAAERAERRAQVAGRLDI